MTINVDGRQELAEELQFDPAPQRDKNNRRVYHLRNAGDLRGGVGLEVEVSRILRLPNVRVPPEGTPMLVVEGKVIVHYNYDLPGQDRALACTTDLRFGVSNGLYLEKNA